MQNNQETPTNHTKDLEQVTFSQTEWFSKTAHGLQTLRTNMIRVAWVYSRRLLGTKV